MPGVTFILYIFYLYIQLFILVVSHKSYNLNVKKYSFIVSRSLGSICNSIERIKLFIYTRIYLFP